MYLPTQRWGIVVLMLCTWRWQCVRLVNGAEMAAVLYAPKGNWNDARMNMSSDQR